MSSNLFTSLALTLACISSALAQSPDAGSSDPASDVTAEVVLKFVIGESGIPSEITILSSTDPDMNRLAIANISKREFPSSLKGKKAEVPIKFTRAMVEDYKAELARRELLFPGAYDRDQVHQAPVQTKYSPPYYPVELRERNIEGSAVIEFCIEPSGEIERAFVKKATRPEFGEAALKMVKKWQFKPGLIDGNPVPVRTTAPVIFSLNQD